MLYIVAGNNNEYRNWVAEQKTFHASKTRYLSNVSQLRGMSNIEGRFIGTCFDRHDIVEIVNCINVIRSGTKPLIKLESLRHLSAYEVMKPRHTISYTGLTNWSQHNIPATITTATQTFLDTLSGKTASTAICDDIPSSYKVPLSHPQIDSFVLVTAKLYKSYIINSYNSIDNTIEYYFANSQEALDFAKKYNATALEYK